MTDIFISSYRLVRSPKPYYVYTIEVSSTELGLQGSIEKRYSAFHSLHRELKKHFTTPPFPPKRMRCTQLKVLEQRKKGLQVYLQEMFRFGPSRSHILNFLGLSPSSSFMKKSLAMDHQPVYRIVSLSNYKTGSLPNIVLKGILSAFYH